MIKRLSTAVVTFFHSFFLPESRLSSRQKWVLGLLNLAAVILFWVSSSFLVNDLFETDTYRKPFFITWVNTSCFALYLIPYLRYKNLSVPEFVEALKQDFHKSRYSRLNDPEGSTQEMPEYGASTDNVAILEGSDASLATSSNPEEVPIYETVMLSLQFTILWFTANLVTNSSLSYTSVASQTILSSTSSFFTLLVGYFYSVEKINTNKVMGIILSFSGVLIVTKIDSSDASNTPSAEDPWLVLWGNGLALLGALVYGIYTILLKHKISHTDMKAERILDTHLFFGFVGLFCLVFLWPIVVLLHFTGLEKFEVPHSKNVLMLLLGNAFITFISDFCWCKAVILTSPLTVTVGLSLTIPLAMVGDWIIKGFNIHFWYVFGAAIVTLGFFVINKDEREDFVSDIEV
ncbi:putative uncharacterized vacuolar membrane protein [Clavispora lusitaniae]|uniref:EamA domain-containing protein n=3 Tax=Clavispora lusitaniae TaxID=36911 RepID=C4XZ71_CLAL4|nr:uncharacterized protein CLUG_01253 [Clavispora lusitaniae ATCC 42720]KAF5212469.1 hypothetical protein E0198_002035 [Clavispora lusitaniae]EEQ37130.1 hypothetical protein CLUG_01253 [Clavispora lusitaniae ATCC 42720]KAF7583888.1 EamA-like transporter family protein [Clavispora lusitaniae]OVF08926.1 putative transporter [Clavispora lusitaniae]QFZ26146.1 putative uncharacterized vacuolar membrane protein [Clavispora lusitaniae]